MMKMKCHFGGCKAPVAFRVVQTNDNGTPGREFFTCAKPGHQHGSRVAGWVEPTERVTRRWSLLGLSGTFTIEPISLPDGATIQRLADATTAEGLKFFRRKKAQ
jgi:hypothetical protein